MGFYVGCFKFLLQRALFYTVGDGREQEYRCGAGL